MKQDPLLSSMPPFDWEWTETGPGSPASRLDKAEPGLGTAWGLLSRAESPLLWAAGSRAGPQLLCSWLLLRARIMVLVYPPSWDTHFVLQDSPTVVHSVTCPKVFLSVYIPGQGSGRCHAFRLKGFESSWVGREYAKRGTTENVHGDCQSPAPGLLKRLKTSLHILNIMESKSSKSGRLSELQSWLYHLSADQTGPCA